MSEQVNAKDVLKAAFAKHEGPEWVRFAAVHRQSFLEG